MNLRDPNQFHAAYRDLYPVAVAAALPVLRDRTAAEDVAQDVFALLWRRPRVFDPSRGNLKQYVSMVARSRAVDRWRSGRAGTAAIDRSEAEQHALRPALQESAAEPVIRREDRRRALTALRDVPPEQRDALLLAYARGMTAQEISDERSIPLGTVKSRVRLGLQKARANLGTAA